MDISYFLKGLIFGFSIAAPVGPIGLLCIQRTLVQGRVFGLVSGLGAATADAIYGLIAGFGLTVLSNFLIGQQFWLRLVGGLFLCYLGVKTFISKASETPAKAQGKNILSTYLSVFFLTLTNPMTILSFGAIFAGLGISNHQNNSVSALILVLGVFLGSALWWLLLSSGVSFFKHRINRKSLTIINRLSGVIILMFAAMSLYGLL
jgi:threonine/homoserine/homoserine lactone efflux protein